MAVINRTQGSDTQKKTIAFNLETSMANGETGVLGYIPYPCQLNALQMTSFYQAGSPFLLLNISRFIVGSGVTVIPLGTTFSIPVFGTSGFVSGGVSLPTGSSLMYLMANDLITYTAGGGSTVGLQKVAGCFVVQPVQDSISYLNALA